MHYLFALTLLLAPIYALRFNLFGLPLNGLMVWLAFLWLVCAAWLLAAKRVFHFAAWLWHEVQTPPFLCAALFFVSGIVSLFTSGVSVEKLGQFIVLFLQPLGTFVLFRYVLCARGTGKKAQDLFVHAGLIFLAVSGFYAVVQYFTLWGVPPAWWGNSAEPKRALSFFLHPNFYALFIAPLLAFLLPSVGKSVLGKGVRRIEQLYPLTAWLLGALGLFFSLSRGGWLGLAAAIFVYLCVVGNKRLMQWAFAGAVVAVLVVGVVPNFRYRVLLPFMGEKSSAARLSLWYTGWKMIEDSPIEGKGLLGFSRNWCAYNTDPGLSEYPAPHNIFLNFWIETGLLGLLSFSALIALALWRGLRRIAGVFGLGLALACVAMLLHGMIDIPYLKNDLALLFWLLYAFI
jgi:O-antigen ligase